MVFYLIILLFLIAILAGLVFWIVWLIKLCRKGRKISFAIQGSVLTIIFVLVTWELQVFPFSKNFYIKERCEQLTGKSFWSWKEFSNEELGVRGEGYTLDIYKFNDEAADYFKNPDSTFFVEYPTPINAQVRWKKTPILEDERSILEFVTPVYVGWKGEIVRRQGFIRYIANRKGSYYSYIYRPGRSSADFYLISPEDRLIIMINHNM